MNNPIVNRVAKNNYGRDFITGDIHGQFHLLYRELRLVSFAPDKDRLFCTGDLVDRGSHSEHAVKWLRRSWFFSCLGNHDKTLLDFKFNHLLLSKSVRGFYSGWQFDVDIKLQTQFLRQFAQIPIVIEVETDRGLVGIIHADISEGLSWQALISRMEQGDEDVLKTALWGRLRAKSTSPQAVEGISDVYLGHTPGVDFVTRTEKNLHFIDTGAGYPDHRANVCITQIQ